MLLKYWGGICMNEQRQFASGSCKHGSTLEEVTVVVHGPETETLPPGEFSGHFFLSALGQNKLKSTCLPSS